MTAKIIDGKAVAAGLRQEIAAAVVQLKARHGLVPGLAVVLVGENPASQVYVRNKDKAVQEVGMASFPKHLPADTTQAALLSLIAQLNADPKVHGILVQLPLPSGLDADAVLAAVDPAKDVDGFHYVNAGKLASGLPGLVPCTPMGCMLLLKTVLRDLDGLHAVVIGRSNIVGKPVAQLLLQANCTVTIAHSRTRDLPAVCRLADIVVAAVGKPEMVRGVWLKPGATVIDVGINRIALPDGKSKLVGDVAYDEAAAVASSITPVPGGVGPMTIACLLRNTLQAACMRSGVALPPACAA
ncbi:MAG: bifunctional methylenetetrahydrofolate dehydrogenase/methenyltetrahydrofolate cyclohydrolase FolD [Alphaproteobacteria bacterium]|nr:bifunctional methylenetetrahydrofolate dehydrogenase/methenyltetrahydrofolate cyclohydrolase FolD [Alphaproteobacteria bacterium]